MNNELNLKKMNDEVFLAMDEIVRLDHRAIEFIKEKAKVSPRKRARICAHQSPTDHLHEMMIAILSDSYIRPHRHHNKIESFHLIEGRADIIIFSEAGEIKDIVKLGADHCFYYRLNSADYHTLIIHSPLLVIHEITNGPFDVAVSDFAKFSPHEKEPEAVLAYLENLKDKIKHYDENHCR